MTTTPLFEFMKARIAEDEANHYPYHSGDFGVFPDQPHGCVECGLGIGQPEERCRVQRECAAKLSIVQYAEALWFEEGRDADTAARYASTLWAVRRLASVYSDHPDYGGISA